MLVAGIGATFDLPAASDGELRYGYSCYSAVGVANPTPGCTNGNYYDAKVHHGFAHFDVQVEGVRFEPTYAPAVLDYGTLENVWSYPAAFPARSCAATISSSTTRKSDRTAKAEIQHHVHRRRC